MGFDERNRDWDEEKASDFCSEFMGWICTYMEDFIGVTYIFSCLCGGVY